MNVMEVPAAHRPQFAAPIRIDRTASKAAAPDSAKIHVSNVLGTLGDTISGLGNCDIDGASESGAQRLPPWAVGGAEGCVNKNSISRRTAFVWHRQKIQRGRFSASKLPIDGDPALWEFSDQPQYFGEKVFASVQKCCYSSGVQVCDNPICQWRQEALRKAAPVIE
ncbi:hypothetical protein SCUP234_01258 [Seiridium cupressi]